MWNMFISYFDESGDDGYPNFSSPLFVLSSVYLHYLNWKDTYSAICSFRQQLKKDFGLPIGMELSTNRFLLNKKPYKKYNFSDDMRILIMDLYCDFISQIDLRIVNVAINKKAIRTTDYLVLDNALTYSIQRIENDLTTLDPAKKFMIITDEGRVSKMRKTSRRIQKINFIPSIFGPYSYRREIKSLIEDPLPKDSKESYFIQIADLVACVVYMHKGLDLGVTALPKRMPAQVEKGKLLDWMERLKASLNLEASHYDPYGVVCYPK